MINETKRYAIMHDARYMAINGSLTVIMGRPLKVARLRKWINHYALVLLSNVSLKKNNCYNDAT